MAIYYKIIYVYIFDNCIINNNDATVLRNKNAVSKDFLDEYDMTTDMSMDECCRDSQILVDWRDRLNQLNEGNNNDVM